MTPSSGACDFRRYEYFLFRFVMPSSSAASADRCIIVSRVVKIRSPSVLSCVSGYVSRSCFITRSTKNGALRDVFGKRVTANGDATELSYSPTVKALVGG